MQQELDNWHVIINWMRLVANFLDSQNLLISKLGISVDNITPEPGQELADGEGVGLDKFS